MKRLLYVGLLASLGGCVSSGPKHGTGLLPEGAHAAIWTSRPQADVATCIAGVTGAAATQDAVGRYLIAVPGEYGTTTYLIGPSDGKASLYPTQVSVSGAVETATIGPRVATCAL